MKKLLTITAAAFMAISASAQSEAGSLTWKPNVGFTYTTPTSDLGRYADGGFGITAGVEAMYMVNEKFGAALGVNYTGYGVTDKYWDNSVLSTNYYFNIPVTANYYVAPGLALKAGIALNILSSAELRTSFVAPYNSSYYSSAEMDYYYGRDLESMKPKDYYKSTFFSIPVGASYEYKNFVLDACYNIGLSKVGEYHKGTYNTFTFTVGYKF